MRAKQGEASVSPAFGVFAGIVRITLAGAALSENERKTGAMKTAPVFCIFRGISIVSERFSFVFWSIINAGFSYSVQKSKKRGTDEKRRASKKSEISSGGKS